MGLDEDFGDLLIGDEEFDADNIGDDSVQSAQDGCRVESDGKCEHGYPSPMRRLGLI